MGYAAFIMGNSQKQFARRSMVIHSKNPQPLTYKHFGLFCTHVLGRLYC